MLERHGRPTAYDVVVVVGNVMVYLADGTEARALQTLGRAAGTGGPDARRLPPAAGPQGSRDYPVEEFTDHVAEAGLVVEQVFGTYDLRPPADDYVVAVLR